MQKRLKALQALAEKVNELAANLADYVGDTGLATSFSVLSDNVELFDTYQGLIDLGQELRNTPTFAFTNDDKVTITASGMEGRVIAVGVFREDYRWMYRVAAMSNGAILGWFYANELEATDVQL